MHQNRIPRLLGALGLAISLAGGTLFGTALAATPLVYISVVASPPQATLGQPIGFIITVDNQDSSTAASSTIDATVPSGTTWASPGVYPTTTSCFEQTETDGEHVVCDLGNIHGGDSVTIALVFDTDALPSTAPSASISVIGYTTGTTTSDSGGTSHGDNFIGSPAGATVTFVESTNGNFAGRFVVPDPTNSSYLVVQNVQTVGSSNLQATSVTVPGVGLGASVEDGPGVSPPGCTISTSVCNSLFGETSAVDVGEGATYGTPFPVTITFSKYELAPGVNQNNIAIYHSWYDGSTLMEETISQSCTFQPKSSSTPSNAPCLVVTKSQGNLVVTIWTFHNGYLRGY